MSSVTLSRKRLLFVCGRNQSRSPTAEKIFSRSPSLEVRSRGLRSSANRRITTDDIAWADLILVMEPAHKRFVLEHFPDDASTETIHVLDIPDQYSFMDPELVELLTTATQGLIE